MPREAPGAGAGAGGDAAGPGAASLRGLEPLLLSPPPEPQPRPPRTEPGGRSPTETAGSCGPHNRLRGGGPATSRGRCPRGPGNARCTSTPLKKKLETLASTAIAADATGRPRFLPSICLPVSKGQLARDPGKCRFQGPSTLRPRGRVGIEVGCGGTDSSYCRNLDENLKWGLGLGG